MLLLLLMNNCFTVRPGNTRFNGDSKTNEGLMSDPEKVFVQNKLFNGFNGIKKRLQIISYLNT